MKRRKILTKGKCAEEMMRLRCAREKKKICAEEMITPARHQDRVELRLEKLEAGVNGDWECK